MEKIKLEIKQQENIKVKVGKQQVEIRPYISSNELIVLSQLCTQKIGADFDTVCNSIILQKLFDMCVVEICTNISVSGITTRYANNILEGIELTLDADKISSFDLYDYRKLLKKNIFNYEDSWKSILEIINIFTIQKSLSNIAKNLPNVNDLGQTIQDLGNAVKEINKDNPNALNDIVQTAMENNAFARTKEQVKANTNSVTAKSKK